MNQSQSRIQTANYIAVKKAYLNDVVLPVVKNLAERIAPEKKYYCIAGKNICIQFYSRKLAEKMTPAIAHTEIDGAAVSGAEDVTIHAWDSVGTQTDFSPPWSDLEYMNQETNAKSVSKDNFTGVYLQGEEMLSLYDLKNKTAYFWTPDADLLPDWAAAAPMRTLLHWFLSEYEISLIHGAAVGLQNRAVLFAAKSGSGKSTTALSCLLSGMDYLADDYVALEFADAAIVHSLYNSIKVAPGTLLSFENLQQRVWKISDKKSILFLSQLFSGHMKKSSVLEAIFIPRIKHAEKTTMTPATKAEAMIALMPTTLFQLPLLKMNSMETIKKVITRLPCYFLELSDDSGEAASVIRAFLEQ